MRNPLALLLAVVAIAGAACHRKETATHPTTASTSTQARRGGEAPTTPPPAPHVDTPAVGVDVGSTMPAFTADLLDGTKFDVAAEKGNVVFLNLWATWCGPCRFEIPELEKMHQAHAKDGFKVVGVSLDDSGVEAVKDFVTQHAMTYPIALDPDGKLANIFQTSVIPTSVVIDRGGKIVWKRYGLVEAGDKSLEAALQKALAEPRT